MPIYIELDKQSSFPPASNAGKLVLGVNTLDQIVITDSSGNTTGINNVSSSYALTASFAQTASYYGGSVLTASFAQTASLLLGSVQSASYAATASLLLGSVQSSSFASTASFVQTAQTASYVLNAVSSSFASTASFVQTAQTASYVLNAVSSSFAATASSYAIPLAGYSWGSGYFNLTNGADNIIRFNTQSFNTHTDIFELSGSGTANARVYLKQAGYYEFISQVHLFDMFNNVDVVVKLLSGSATGTMGLVSLFNNDKFAELTADRTINGTIIVNVTTPGYYAVAINPSTNSPFPSNDFNTPTRLFIKKLV